MLDIFLYLAGAGRWNQSICQNSAQSMASGKSGNPRDLRLEVQNPLTLQWYADDTALLCADVLIIAGCDGEC